MFTVGYTFDDVLLVPKYSRVKSRSDVDLSVDLPRGIKLDIPIISANMKTVTGPVMAAKIADLGGIGLLHRFDNDILTDYLEAVKLTKHADRVGTSFGIKDRDLYLASVLHNAGCKILCVDVAHGDHQDVYEFTKKLREKCPDALIISGNVATPTGADLLWRAGADIIRAGIGSGSLCSTRIETGNGYPQLSAIQNIANHAHYEYSYDNRPSSWPIFISDGGIRTAGDCVKALAFVELVMVGNVIAGTDEAPGNIITVHGKSYKQYAGSSTHKPKNVEGVIGLVPYKGPVETVINKMLEGIRSGCSYQGAKNLTELRANPEFVVISNSGLKESHPHDIIL